jgi:hypothetical protein
LRKPYVATRRNSLVANDMAIAYKRRSAIKGVTQGANECPAILSLF